MNKEEFTEIKNNLAEFIETQHKGVRYILIVEGQKPYDILFSGKINNPYLAECIQVLQRIWVDNNKSESL